MAYNISGTDVVRYVSNLHIKQLLILITFLCLALTVHSQQKLTKFEKELNEFRYSLYESLDTVPFEILKNMDLEAFNGIEIKIEKFLEDHKKEIRQYKLDILNMYKDMPIPDLEGYNTMVGEDEIKEINSSFNEIFTQVKVISNFCTLDIRSELVMNITMFFGRAGPESLASESIINTIAAYRTITRQKDKDNWQIVIDRNKYLFEFTYSMLDNSLYFKNVYKKYD